MFALAIFFWIVADIVTSHRDYLNSDFFSFWLAGHMVWSHQYPYASAEWVPGHTLFGAEWISDQTFLYPLPLALLFAPLGLLSVYQAFVAWVWLSEVMLAATLRSLLTLFGRDQKHYFLPILMGVVLFRPIFILPGQLGAFLLLVIVAAGVLWEKSRWTLGGSLLGLTALKPSIGAPILLLSALYLLFKRRFEALGGMVLTGAVILVSGMAYNAGWVWDYVQILLDKHQATFGFSPNLWGLAAYACRLNYACTLYVGGLSAVFLILIYVLVFCRRTNLSPLLVTGAAVALAVLITPYLWPYDQILLTLPIVLTMLLIRQYFRPYLASALYFLAIDMLAFLLLAVTGIIQLENLNGAISMLVFAVLTALALRSGTPGMLIANSNTPNPAT